MVEIETLEGKVLELMTVRDIVKKCGNGDRKYSYSPKHYEKVELYPIPVKRSWAPIGPDCYL